MNILLNKWKRAPKKRVCVHQNVELLSHDNDSRTATRMGHTMVHCVMGCDSTWWEPNTNLERLGLL